MSSWLRQVGRHSLATSLVSRSSLEHLALALGHALVLLPLVAVLAILTHVIAPAPRNEKQPLVHPWSVRRLATWSWLDTMVVAVMTQLFAACAHLEQVPAAPPMEHFLPRLSEMFLGVRHQGWQLHCEPITIPGIPTKEADDSKAVQSKSATSSRPSVQRVVTEEALPYSLGLSSLLQGDFRRGTPPACPAMWLWKTQAAHVKGGEIAAVKPEAQFGGLGCGPAEEGERVVLLLAGSGLADNGPLVGPIAWSITRQSGLRMLVVNMRKMSSDAMNDHFAAPLQDALAGYTYLVDRLDFLPRNITLLGEGRGASLCVSLTLYLSALSQSTSPVLAKMSRPGKMLLFSPWCDLTVSADILRQHSLVDVLDVDALLQARSLYVESFDKRVREEDWHAVLDELCRRYEESTAEPSDIDLALLASELTSTVDLLGPSHPLISPGMPISCNKYTRLALRLLEAGTGPALRVLVCAGGASAHVTEAQTLATNLSSVNGLQIDYIEGEDKVSTFPFATAGQANTRVDEISQTFLRT